MFVCLILTRGSDAACVNVQVGQGRPHIFCDMRLVDDTGKELPRDGEAVGNLQVGHWVDSTE